MRHPLLDWPALASDYARYHRSRGNQLCHLLGIPLIVFAVVAWTQWPAGNRVPLVAVVLPLYFLWDVRLGLQSAAVLAAMAALAPLASPGGVFGAFAIGWLFQLAGHTFFEGQSPAFTRNLVHLLVGPAWLLRKATASR
ncbi:MAG: DUF962 domain-containing protein [Elusimicrobia bacterium]|nr:DUF962 domain-containing protein [Elusimicrobiota bacterium]